VRIITKYSLYILKRQAGAKFYKNEARRGKILKFFETWQNFKNQPQKYGEILKFKEAKFEKLTNLG